MAKHPTSSRVHRDPDQPEDAFLAGVDSTVRWARENSRLLIIGAIVLALLILGAIYYTTAQRRIEAEAANRFAELQATLVTANPQLAIRDLEAFVQRFGSASAADQARVILGELLIRQDRPQEAVEALGELPDDLDDPYGIAAARVLAAAHEALGNADQAVEVYRRIADNARFEFQRQESLADAARVRLQNGDAESAADLYEDVLATFDENEPGRGYYEMWLAEARAQAGDEALTAGAPAAAENPAASGEAEPDEAAPAPTPSSDTATADTAG